MWGKQTMLYKAPSTLISQNPRVIKVGKDLQDLQVQPASWPPNPLVSHVPQGWGLGSTPQCLATSVLRSVRKGEGGREMRCGVL